MPPKRKSRVYARNQGGSVRYYGDFRDFADVGGGREALIARGEKRATADPDVAAALVTARVKELEGMRRRRSLLELRRETTLQAFAREHLEAKARGIRTGAITAGWVANAELHLQTAIDFFGAGTDLSTITVAHVRAYARYLEELPTRRAAGTLSPGTQRKYLNSLSNLYARAQEEEIVPPGFNPVASMMDKPRAAREEAAWLEVPDAAVFLEAARTWQPKREDTVNPAIYELVATMLLTGGRRSEVFGLAVEDIAFDRKFIRIRPNEHRRLKTTTSRRTVPLWPQLEEILREYVFGSRGPRSGLLFPAPKTGGMVTDMRKALDAIGDRVGYAPNEITTKMFRHTYCATRLQTLDRGHPVSPWTVAKEMGHGGRALVDQVYGHLGTIGHRSEVVEYRPEHYLSTHGTVIADLRAAAV